MPQVICTECGWTGEAEDTLSNVYEDSDGDLVGEYLLACPECHASTVDSEQFDSSDMGDGYGG